MSFYDNIIELKENAKCYYAQRVVAELVYAAELSKIKDGAFDEIIKKATHFLYTSFKENEAITTKVAEKCEEMLLPISNEAKKLTLYCASHAHIDMNWMWGFNETIAITLDTFRTMLKLMDEYPQFIYSQSQASTYKIVEEYDPLMFEQIKKRVCEGRWEITASTWVEADKNMPNGESMARQILYTKKYFEEKFSIKGDDLALDFEPDTFGHNSSVPEVLNNGNVKYYYHCRGYNGHNIYNWYSPSGKSVLVYREPAWYNTRISSDLLAKVPSFCYENNIEAALVVYGVGDHGGGPTRRDIECIIDMSNWPVAPKVEFSSFLNFFKELEKNKDRFPKVEGELNYVFTACYSSQSRIKMANKTAENNLFASEAITSLSVNFANGQPYSQNYKKSWEKVLFNQFHDILPGSGVRETREYALGIFQEALGYTYTGRTRALTEFADCIDTSSFIDELDLTSSSEGAGVGFKGSWDTISSNVSINHILFPERGNGKRRIFHIYNPTQYERCETVEVTIWDYPGKISQIDIKDINNENVCFEIKETAEFWQHTFTKLLIFAKVKSFGYNTYIVNEKQKDSFSSIMQPDTNPRIEIYNNNVLENESIKAVFDDNMMLVSLYNKKTGKESINGKSAYFNLTEYNHKLGTGMPVSAWVEGYPSKTINLNETQNVFITSHNYGGRLRHNISYSIPYNNSNINVVLSLDKDSDLLKYKIDCNWLETYNEKTGIPSLKFCVPFCFETDEYTYQIPFGTIVRKADKRDVPSIGFAYAEHKKDNLGIALFSDNTYAFCGENNSLGMTLLRSSQFPDQFPEYGLSTTTIGIAADYMKKEDLYNKLSSFAHPLIYFSNTAHKGSLPLEKSFIQTQGEISVSTVKLPEDSDSGFIIRVFDVSGNGGAGAIIINEKILSAQIVDIVEQSTEGILSLKDNKVEFALKPNEVITIKIAFQEQR